MRADLPHGGGSPHLNDVNQDMSDTHNSIFFAAVSTTRMPMVITDPNQPDNPIVFANPAFINMTGYDYDELVGKNCRLLQGPETDRAIIAKVKTAIAERRDIAVEILNYKKNKSTFWNALFISPVFDKQNNLLYFFASQLDVTHRRDVEDALRQSQKMEAVGQLTGGIAHDFNNLLTVVSGFAEILELNLNRAEFDSRKALRALENIKQATDKGAMLTSQLLAFSRKQKLQGRIVNLKDLINHLLPLIEQSVGAGIEVKVQHTPHPCNTRVDPIQANTAIINVAVNARDAMNGKGNLLIKTSPCMIDSADSMFGTIEYGDYTHLEITDYGCGMDPDTVSKMTEPFFTTKGEGKGTGLGMSMVYGFVTQSKGAMAVESQIGKGTTIHMLFKCEDSGIDSDPVKAQRVKAEIHGDQETILIVEDKEDVAEYAVDVLSDFGYKVLLAHNADDALVLLTKHDEIQVLFSDIVMPGSMNGVQLAQEVMRLYPHIKILLTTGYTDTSVDIVDKSGSPFNLISKPYRVGEIRERMKDLIRGPDGIS